MKFKYIMAFVLCFALSFSLVSSEAYSLRLVLKRVVFEGPKRSEVLTLINASDEAETYRLLWRDMIMTPDKGLEAVEEGALPDNVKPAKDYIKYAPRRVTLGPNSSQQIRMALRMPSDVPDGEYRSHLWIRKEAAIDKLRVNEDGEREITGANKRSVEIVLLPGITVPVIARKGNLEVRTGISDASARRVGSEYLINFTLLREGQKSTYGDIDFICNPNGQTYELRAARGIAVYTELNAKPVNFKFKVVPEQPACRELRIRYVQTDGFAGDDLAVYAETIIPVN